MCQPEILREITDQFWLTSQPALEILRNALRNRLHFTGRHLVCDQMRGRVKIDAFSRGQESLDAMTSSRSWHRELGARSCCLDISLTTCKDPFHESSEKSEFESFGHYLVHIRQCNTALSAEGRRQNKQIRKHSSACTPLRPRHLFHQSGTEGYLLL